MLLEKHHMEHIMNLGPDRQLQAIRHRIDTFQYLVRAVEAGRQFPSALVDDVGRRTKM